MWISIGHCSRQMHVFVCSGHVRSPCSGIKMPGPHLVLMYCILIKVGLAYSCSVHPMSILKFICVCIVGKRRAAHKSMVNWSIQLCSYLLSSSPCCAVLLAIKQSIQDISLPPAAQEGHAALERTLLARVGWAAPGSQFQGGAPLWGAGAYARAAGDGGRSLS